MNGIDSQKKVEDLSWMELVRQAVNKKKLVGSTCHLYSTKQVDDKSITSKRCLCGRLARKHSFAGEPQTDLLRTSDEWQKFEHASEVPVTVFGILQNKIKFVRWDYTRVKSSANKTTTNNKEPKISLSTMANILLTDADNKKPTLLISCYGGAKYFKMNDKLEKEFMDGIGQAAATEGVWLLSTGLNSGVSKVIGQSVWRHALLSEKPTNHTVIGLSSWGCLSEKTQEVLRRQAKLDFNANKKRRISIIKMSTPLLAIGTGDYYSDSSLLMLDDNQPDTLESNHTHFLLLDDGSQGDHTIEGKTDRYYIPDEPRSIFVEELITSTQCCAVTIIIEGGLDSISVIANDLHAKRPVVIIHGSGRLANAIGNLLELTRDQITVGNDEIERQLKKVDARKDLKKYFKEIQFILEYKYRPYLSVFKLDDNSSLTDTIFLAVFKARMHRENENKTDNNSDERASNLKELLDLSVNWNYVNGINYLFENKEATDYDQKWNIDLFEKALISNRPAFVDYFLRRQYDVLQTSDYIEFKNKNKNNEKTIQEIATSLRAAIKSTLLLGKNQVTPMKYNNEDKISSVDDDDDAIIRAVFDRAFIIEKLYVNPIDHLKSYHIQSVTDLDNLYYRLIGHYAESFFRVRSTKARIEIDLHDKGHSFLAWFNKHCRKNTTVSPVTVNSLNTLRSSKVHPEMTIVTLAAILIPKMNSFQEIVEFYGSVKAYGNEEMLRDIFLWSVISGHAEMSFVLLLQVRSRIIASLVAAGITSRFLSTKGGYLGQWHRFQKQSNDYEQFGTSCIDACYKRSERRACQLLLREIPLFGNITCMQVAITFRLQSFINSRCFNEVLNRQWYGTLDQTTNQSILSIILFLISVISIGLLAPFLLDYRNDDIHKLNVSDNESESSSNHRWEGIEDQDNTDMNYFQKVRQFHRTPVVRMFYDFLFYIWMLLAFSYMMLFEMKSENTSIHWTEIYVIITISAMLIEDIRKIIIEYHTQMLERWHQSDIWIINLYALPYVLFYIGIGIQFGSTVRPDLFTTARIVLALDLEVWFLFSLRFVSAIKILGPKLFMIRNMLKDLVGFIYIIFVCIIAYGIVSRSLTMYNNIEFNAKNLSTAILYRPYWFLYGDVDDEKDYYDGIIDSTSSTADEIAEATTDQVLLAFHMLFINILILSLLIAVFNFTINDVQEKSEYLWRYQRYELIREYFEKPAFAYPPLSLLGYLWLLIKLIRGRKDVLRIFKRYGTNKMNKDWTDFESAATSNYTRTFVGRMYHDSSTLIIPTFSETDELKIEIDSLKRYVERMDIQSKKITLAMNWMMTAMDRVKMSSKRPPPLVTASTSDA